MKVHSSALKHGVEEPDVVQAAEWPLWSSHSTTTAHRSENYGSASTPVRRLLETVVLIFEDGAEVVIHAMPCRKKYLDLLP